MEINTTLKLTHYLDYLVYLHNNESIHHGYLNKTLTETEKSKHEHEHKND